MVEIGGEKKLISIEEVEAVARGMQEVALSAQAVEKINSSRRLVEKIQERQEIVYGVTTGFGALKNTFIEEKDRKLLQKNLVESHAAGIGEYLAQETVRAIMLAHANNLSRGYSGIRLEAVQALIDLLNKQVHPAIPEKGSVGASGDLAPLSHLALVLIGEGEAFYNNELMPGGVALEKAGLKKLELEAKEGLSLINGTAVMTGIAALAVFDAICLAKHVDVTGALSLEALLGTDKAFRKEIQEAKPHAGQIQCASNLRELTQESTLVNSRENVQDAYSLRCMPQVHGASRDAIAYARRVVETELNSCCDNPLVFENQIISGGNFHGQPVALAADFLAIAVAELANISERRTARLVDAKLNEGLPAFLVENSGVNSGYMISQYAAAALVSENKVLAHPASVDSIPTCANQEDHVSMGTIAARKASAVIKNAQSVIAIEMLCASQALDFRLPKKSGKGTRIAHQTIREKIKHWGEDRILYEDLRQARQLIESNAILSELEKQGLVVL